LLEGFAPGQNKLPSAASEATNDSWRVKLTSRSGRVEMSVSRQIPEGNTLNFLLSARAEIARLAARFFTKILKAQHARLRESSTMRTKIRGLSGSDGA